MIFTFRFDLVNTHMSLSVESIVKDSWQKFIFLICKYFILKGRRKKAKIRWDWKAIEMIRFHPIQWRFFSHHHQVIGDPGTAVGGFFSLIWSSHHHHHHHLFVFSSLLIKVSRNVNHHIVFYHLVVVRRTKTKTKKKKRNTFTWCVSFDRQNK